MRGRDGAGRGRNAGHGIAPFALAYKDAWTIKMATLVAYDNYVYGPHPDWTDLRNQGKVSFSTSPEWQDVLDAQRLILKYGNTSTAFETDYDGATVLFATGRAAMLLRQDGPRLYSRKESLGLANLRARLHLFYQGRAEVSIRSRQGGGTVVTLALPADPFPGGDGHGPPAGRG